MSSPLRPGFFCVRPNGGLTPLIPIDELPINVNVRGVSRILNPRDTQGMISCGAAEPRSEPWALDSSPQVGDLTELQDVLYKILSDREVPNYLQVAVKNVLNRSLHAPVLPGAPTKTLTGRRANSPDYRGNTGHFGHGKHGFNPKKEFCSYWIRHGECDYQQQGCLYKHEMPSDVRMLEKLGLRDIPRWYREKFGVPSLLQASYGNNPRGQQSQAAINQPQHRAIQFQSPANSVSNVGPSAHAGHSGHNNSNQSRPRGGRYKSPRGAGFAGSNKGRNNKNGEKALGRNGVTPPPPSVSGHGSPGTTSVGLSDVPSSGGSPHLSPEITPRTQQSVLASPDVGPIVSSKEFFRTKSRFTFGADSKKDEDNLAIKSSDPYASLAQLDIRDEATPATAPSPISKLVAASEPIDPKEPLVNWGMVGMIRFKS